MPGPSSVVVAVTLGLTAAAVGHALRFGADLPVWDEWDLIPELLQTPPAEWLLRRHNEHRFVPARAVYLGVFHAAGGDLRAGQVVSALLHGVAAGGFAVAAARLRGRASFGDVLLPALVLHWGHAFNWLMAYQIAFGLFLLAVAWLAWLLPGRRGGPVLLAVGLIGLGGGMGVACLPPLAVWLLVRGGPRWVPAVGLPLIAGYVGWTLIGVPPSGDTNRATGWAVPGAVCQYLATGVGLGDDHTGRGERVGVGLAGLLAAAVGVLLWKARRATDRPVAGGLLALVAGVGVMAVGVAARRNDPAAARYAGPAALGLVLVWLTAARYLPASRWLTAVGVVAAAGLVTLNLDPGWRAGGLHRMEARDAQAAVGAGLPPRFLADRLGSESGRLAVNLADLRRLGYRRFAALPPDRPVRADPLADRDAWTTLRWYAAERVTRPVPPPAGRVVGLRAEVEWDEPPPWFHLRLRWAGGESVVRPPRLPGRHVVWFWVGGAAADAVLEPVGPTFGVRVRATDWLAEP